MIRLLRTQTGADGTFTGVFISNNYHVAEKQNFHFAVIDASVPLGQRGPTEDPAKVASPTTKSLKDAGSRTATGINQGNPTHASGRTTASIQHPAGNWPRYLRLRVILP